MLADGLTRAEWLRATIHNTFAKRFPVYSTKAQQRIESNDTLAVASGANPRMYLTREEFLMVCRGKRSTLSENTMIFPIEYKDYKGEWVNGGACPIDMTQKGLDEVLPKLIERGHLLSGIDYILR